MSPVENTQAAFGSVFLWSKHELWQFLSARGEDFHNYGVFTSTTPPLSPPISLLTSARRFSHSALNALQSFPQVSATSLSSPSLFVTPRPLPSTLSLLVISTCQAKGSRQMDGQMNTQICRGAKRMMERWNKGVTVRDCTQLSPVQGLGGSRGEREEEKHRQEGENEERERGC